MWLLLAKKCASVSNLKKNKWMAQYAEQNCSKLGKVKNFVTFNVISHSSFLLLRAKYHDKYQQV